MILRREQVTLLTSLHTSRRQILIMSDRLQKAIIPTPHSGDGHVAWDHVPVGAAVWVTVKDDSSPLHGRPILVSKRPDGQLALEGGSGDSHWGGSSADRARKHLVLGHGRDEVGTAKDRSNEKERRELAAKNAPLLQARKDVQVQSKANIKAASDKFKQALGIKDSYWTKDEKEKRRAQALELAKTQGADDATAKVFADAIVREASRADKQIRDAAALRTGAGLLKQARLKQWNSQPHDPNAAPDPNAQAALPADPAQQVNIADVLHQAQDATSAQDIQQAVAQHFDQVVQHALDPNAPPPPSDIPQHSHDNQPAVTPQPIGAQDSNAPVLTVGGGVSDVAQQIQDPAAAKAATDAFSDYLNTQHQEREISKQIQTWDGAAIATPPQLQQLRTKIGDLPDDQVDQLIGRYEQAGKANSAGALYNAASQHWNDNLGYADGIGTHIQAGASAALSSLVGQDVGARFNVGKLVELTSPEAAAQVLAFHLREQHARTMDQFGKIVDRVEQFNAENQQTTEDAALQQHQALEAERGKIHQQVAAGELGGGTLDKPIEDMTDNELHRLSAGDIAAGAAGLAMEADVLLRQRQNIGTAMGSLQASAAMYHALTHAQKADNAQIVLTFGDNHAAAQDRFDDLRLSQGHSGELRHDIHDGWQIATSYKGLKKYLSEQALQQQQHDEWQKIKTDDSDTGGYQVPFWKDKFQGDNDEQAYKWRKEQRNDIEWLRKAGGGVVTRVTGAGKTNTALGFYAHKIADNPQYRGVVVVPRGKVAEWGSEARKFTSLPVVQIPEGARKDDVARIMAQAEPGSVMLLSHKDAASNHELLAEYKPDGVTIDEPQEFTTSKNANLSGGAKRVMGIPAQNRIALTATPARKNVHEAYDLVNWTNPKALGARTRFVGAYGGFGAGTNSADAAIIDQLSKEIAPYIAGDRLTDPSFTTHWHDNQVQRTDDQRSAQKQIERASQAHIGKVADAVPDADRTGNWRRRARMQALDQLRQDRASVLSGSDAKHTGVHAEHNAKVDSVIDNFKQHPQEKHVIYVDSATQRQQIKRRLVEEGLKDNQIQNMAASTGTISGADIGKRKLKFQTDPNSRVVFIDRVSAAGHNLQQANHLHIVGNPSDAANYLQAQGRVRRDPRTSDVHVHTYRYSDDPSDDAHWDALHAQLKLMRATSPGLIGKSKLFVRLRRRTFLPLRITV